MRALQHLSQHWLLENELIFNQGRTEKTDELLDALSVVRGDELVEIRAIPQQIAMREASSNRAHEFVEENLPLIHTPQHLLPFPLDLIARKIVRLVLLVLDAFPSFVLEA